MRSVLLFRPATQGNYSNFSPKFFNLFSFYVDFVDWIIYNPLFNFALNFVKFPREA